MAVSIRLARIGKKKAPFYRIVAIDKRKSRDGEYLENLGTYNPLTGELIQFHAERIQAWLDKGAIASDTVVKLQKQSAHAAKKALGSETASVAKKAVKKAAPKKIEAVEKVVEQDSAVSKE